MKRFCIIVLSVLLLYTGVAWALGKCLSHTWDLGHTHELQGEVHTFEHALEHPSSHPATHAGPEAKFDCPHFHNRMELTLPTRARTQLSPLSERAFLQESPGYRLVAQDSPDLRLCRRLIFGESAGLPYHSNLNTLPPSFRFSNLKHLPRLPVSARAALP